MSVRVGFAWLCDDDASCRRNSVNICPQKSHAQGWEGQKQRTPRPGHSPLCAYRYTTYTYSTHTSISPRKFLSGQKIPSAYLPNYLSLCLNSQPDFDPKNFLGLSLSSFLGGGSRAVSLTRRSCLTCKKDFLARKKPLLFSKKGEKWAHYLKSFSFKIDK